MLNKKQRHKIYKQALIEYEKISYLHLGLCYAMHKACILITPNDVLTLSIYKKDHDESANETRYFPELDKFNPHADVMWWFSERDHQRREDILNTCIEQTE